MNRQPPQDFTLDDQARSDAIMRQKADGLDDRMTITGACFASCPMCDRPVVVCHTHIDDYVMVFDARPPEFIWCELPNALKNLDDEKRESYKAIPTAPHLIYHVCDELVYLAKQREHDNTKRKAIPPRSTIHDILDAYIPHPDHRKGSVN